MQKKIDLARNLTINTLTSGVETALGLFSGILIARALGPHEYGIYAFSVWLCGMIIYACNSSFTSSAIKFIAESRGGKQENQASAVAYLIRRKQLRWSTLCVGSFVLGVFLSMPKEWSEFTWLMPSLAVVAIWSRANFRMLATIGQGYEKYAPENWTIVIAAIVNLAAISLLVLEGATFDQYFAIYAALGFLMTAIARRLLRNQIRIEPGPIPTDTRQRIRKHIVTTGAFMSLSLLTGRVFEMTLLKIHWSTAEVGYFAIAGALTKGAIELLASGLTAALLPAMAREFGEGGKVSLGRVFCESMRIYWFIGLLLAGISLVVTNGMVRLLYGEKYVGAIAIITTSLVITGLCSFNAASATALAASDHQKDRIHIAICSITLNAIVAFALIPRYGLTGAGISLVATRLFDAFAGHWCATYRLGTRLKFGPLIRLAVAAAAAAAIALPCVVLLTSRFDFILAAFVFILLYVWFSILLRIWRPTDVALGVAILTRISPGRARLHARMASFQHNYIRRLGTEHQAE